MAQIYLGNAIYEEIIRLGLEPGQFVYTAVRARLDLIREGKIKVTRSDRDSRQ
jgi:hypothetical protein